MTEASVLSQRGIEPLTFRLYDAFLGCNSKPFLEVNSGKGTVWIDPDMRFENLGELKMDMLLLLRGLVGEATWRKVDGKER